MILLGLLLLILGLVLGIGILYTIGIVLVIIGAVLWVLGSHGPLRRRPKALLVTESAPVAAQPGRRLRLGGEQRCADRAAEVAELGQGRRGCRCEQVGRIARDPLA